MSLASYHCSTPGSTWLRGSGRSGAATGGRGGSRRSPFTPAVAAENSRRREFAQFMAHHVLGHVQLHELLAVVDHERVADKLRHNGAISCPGLQRLAAAGGVLPVHLRPPALTDVGAL